MRFIHAADLHLDSPLRSVALRDPDLGSRLALASREVLTRIVDLAIEHEVDALVLAGDVFDGAEPDLAARAHLMAELARLGRADIPTLVIRGNHDALMDLERHGPLGKAVHLLDAARPSATIRGVDFHGLSHETTHSHQSALHRYPGPTAGRRNVGIMHTSLDGTSGHDPYAPCSTADLMGHGFDYWALGHIHRRSAVEQDGTWVVMPGIPQGRHIREPGVGSVTFVTMGDATTVEAVPIARLAFEGLEIDMGGLGDGTARVDAVAAALAGVADAERDVALRITLRGDGAAAWADDPRTHLDSIAAGLGRVHIESVRLTDLAPPKGNQLAGSLLQLMQEEAAKPAFRARAAETLAKLSAALPPELRTELANELSEEGIDELLDNGMAGVVARLTDR